MIDFDGPSMICQEQRKNDYDMITKEKNWWLTQRVWTTTPIGTINQELKLLTMHLILN